MVGPSPSRYGLRSSSGSLAMLRAMRRASSRVSPCMAMLLSGTCAMVKRRLFGEGVMRAFTIIVTVATIGTFDPAVAQTTTPNVVTPTPGLQTPLTFTTTNCMMSCNSQAANCQTGCVVPPPPFNAPGPPVTLSPATPPPAGTLNTTGSTACLMRCTSTQLACQSGCALNSPSR
jgi:hypothetical protein